MLVLVYFAGLSAPLNQFKVPPMMQQLMKGFDISLAASGWLMSCFALAGFVFAFPAGIILLRTGVKKLGLIALTVIFAGSTMGSSACSTELILFSRAMEGAGMSLFSVVAPAAVSAWFPSEKRGIPMGIWATWVPAGNVLIFTLAPFIGTQGWKHVWIFSSAYAAVMFLLFLLFFSMPPEYSLSSKASRAAGIFTEKTAWMLALIFMLFNIVTISIKSYLPAFLENTKGFSPLKAAGVTSVMMVCSMIAAPIAGIVSDRLGSRKKIIQAACIGAFITVCTAFNVYGAMVSVSLVFIGIAGGAMPAGIFTAATELADTPAESGAYMSIIILGQYLGMFAGPVLFSSVAGSCGWMAASYALIPVVLSAALLSLKLRVN